MCSSDLLYKELQKEGIGAILDDRENLNIGAKIRDVKVLGTPYVVVIGDKTEGENIEIENMLTGDKQAITIKELIEKFK